MAKRDDVVEIGNLEKLGEIINDIDIAMLTTVDENGFLRSRPMATQELGQSGQIWFFTDATSKKASEVKKNNQVNVVYAEPKNRRFVSISGRASFVHDKNKMQELWSPSYLTWFPDGLDDPRLVLLKITIEHAEYWDAPTLSFNALILSFRTRRIEDFYREGTHGLVNRSL